jgi:chromatin segregation and condensation protein Rec8/ScpA/Scc1 (kleisin family)
MFKALTAKMEPVEKARCFIAMLYLAMKDKIDLEQQDDSDDVKITLKVQPEQKQ